MKIYYMLTKPGIILGNAITTAAGFSLASKGTFDIWLFFITLMGLSLVIASAGVFNNYIDRAIDAKMDRTKERPLAKGLIAPSKALLFATSLGVMGFFTLAHTNWLTVAVAFFGFFIYLTLYAFFKSRSFYGTLIGSLAGAVPPVVGYCSVSNQLDLGGFLLFTLLILWQMPHFFAIAIYRFKEYSAASIPVLPIVKGIHATKIQMLLYIIAFTIVASSLTFAGYTGYFYLTTALFLGFTWLGLCFYGLSKKEDFRWARQMFAYSLVVITVLSINIIFESHYSI